MTLPYTARFFVAAAEGSNVNRANAISGRKGTFEEASAWGKDFLSKNINATEVVIFEAVAIVERDSPPVRVRHIPYGIKGGDGKTDPLKKPITAYEALKGDTLDF